MTPTRETLNTECCNVPMPVDSRYCPKCGQEARVTREPHTPAEVLKAAQAVYLVCPKEAADDLAAMLRAYAAGLGQERVDAAFHKLTVAQRDAAWQELATLTAENERLKGEHRKDQDAIGELLQSISARTSERDQAREAMHVVDVALTEARLEIARLTAAGDALLDLANQHVSDLGAAESTLAAERRKVTEFLRCGPSRVSARNWRQLEKLITALGLTGAQE